MTPEEILEAADKVKAAVEAGTKGAQKVIDLMDILKQLPELPAPPIHERPMGPWPRGTACPNYPNPCYCTGACRTLGDFKKPPGTLTVYC